MVGGGLVHAGAPTAPDPAPLLAGPPMDAGPAADGELGTNNNNNNNSNNNRMQQQQQSGPTA